MTTINAHQLMLGKSTLVKNSLQGLFLVALVIVITALAQVAQLYTSYDELRMSMLTEWANFVK